MISVIFPGGKPYIDQDWRVVLAFIKSHVPNPSASLFPIIDHVGLGRLHGKARQRSDDTTVGYNKKQIYEVR